MLPQRLVKVRYSKFNFFAGTRRLEYRKRGTKAAYGVHGRYEWRSQSPCYFAEMIDLKRKRIGLFWIDVLGRNWREPVSAFTFVAP